MTQIKVNGTILELLEDPPAEVHSLEILSTHFPPTIIPLEYSKPIQEWIYNISQSVTNIITYNKIITQKEDVVRPPHMN